MEKRALISIIIPVYNVKNYLDRCMDSVTHQTYTNIEILIIDDGSEDGSGNLCDIWAEKDKRIKVFHKQNGGLSSARNYGLRRAKGEFIGFVDSDDYISLDMYEKLSEAMEHNIDIVTCGIVLENSGRDKGKNRIVHLPDSGKRNVFYTKAEAIEEFLLSRSLSSSMCNKLFRRRLFQGLHFPVGRTSEDIPVMFRLLLKSRGVLNIGQVKYHYVTRSDSISRQGFFYRRADWAIFAGHICKEITIHNPQLKKQSEVFYMRSLLHILIKIHESNHRVEFSALEKRLKKALLKMIEIGRASCRERVFGLV